MLLLFSLSVNSLLLLKVSLGELHVAILDVLVLFIIQSKEKWNQRLCVIIRYIGQDVNDIDIWSNNQANTKTTMT